MKSKHILAGGVLAGVFALSASAHAGPLDGVVGIGTGFVGIGGASSGSMNVPFGGAAFNGSRAAFGAAGSASAFARGAANAGNVGRIGAGANGPVTGNLNSALSANPTAIKSMGQGALHTGSRAAGSGNQAVAVLRDSAADTVDAGADAAATARTAANAASSRLIPKTGKVSGRVNGDVSTSAGTHASGGAGGFLDAQGSADVRMRAGASAQ